MQEQSSSTSQHPAGLSLGKYSEFVKKISSTAARKILRTKLPLSQTLPQELFAEIFSYLLDDKPALRNCTAVCKAWRPFSCHYLKQDKFSIREPRAIFRYKGEFDRFASFTHMHDTVRWLSISDMRIDFATLGETLIQLKNLKGVSLEGVEFHMMWQQYKPPPYDLLFLDSLTISDTRSEWKYKTKDLNKMIPRLSDVLIWVQEVETLKISETNESYPSPLMRARLKTKNRIAAKTLNYRQTSISYAELFDPQELTTLKLKGYDDPFSWLDLNFTLIRIGSHLTNLSVAVNPSVASSTPMSPALDYLNLHVCRNTLKNLSLCVSYNEAGLGGHLNTRETWCALQGTIGLCTGLETVKVVARADRVARSQCMGPPGVHIIELVQGMVTNVRWVDVRIVQPGDSSIRQAEFGLRVPQTVRSSSQAGRVVLFSRDG
ncbi:hypothetical protein BDW22DRAFT_1482669 [Trametopsis cervina]|nr:hypothetical protein BDW22DRAFT_1482669 [Trametopsis cervina]